MSQLIARHSNWHAVESYTTREERKEESLVKPYRFVSVEQFMSLVKSGDIVEYEKYAGNWYGTSAESLEVARQKAPVVLMDLQLKGVEALKERYPDALDIYLRVSLGEVRRRLMSDWRRAGTPQVEMLSRLAAVARQNRRAKKFTAVVDSIPGDIAATVRAVESAILSRLKSAK